MQCRQDRLLDRTVPVEDLLVTGGSGFLGAQFVAGWLQRHQRASAGCLIRSGDDNSANLKLQDALRGVGEDWVAAGGIDAMLRRAEAIRGDVSEPDWIQAATRWRSARPDRPFRLLHCAANLSFRAADREAVRAANIDGTRAMLAAARQLGASEFNYVSTAYVAGNRGGDILEDATDRPPGFSNAYEESKWEAEALVRSTCHASGMPFRILRPSIIIAHSVTQRFSAPSGFYKVIETMRALGRLPRAHGQTILLPLPHGSTLDLIPVDVVVDEMIQLLDAGDPSLGHAFHLTSDSPLSLIEVLATLSPLSGLTIGRAADGGGPDGRLAEMLMQRLRHYVPYFAQIRRFDRRNVRAAGVGPQRTLDVESLRHYVMSFLAQAA